MESDSFNTSTLATFGVFLYSEAFMSSNPTIMVNEHILKDTLDLLICQFVS